MRKLFLTSCTRHNPTGFEILNVLIFLSILHFVHYKYLNNLFQ